MSASDTIKVELVAGVDKRQLLVECNARPGITVRGLVDACQILNRIPELQEEQLQFGIWGRVVSPEHVVAEGDRVEIYRPLKLDPREARRQLALAGKTMRGNRSEP
jgi:putative ubiquitin-RnfH superfamily antitoxin RatB of RatAB toxin-antitoxin module